jgi:hypothetical protein
MRIAIVAALAAATLAGPARAEVVEQVEGTFRTRNAVDAPVSAEKAWAALGEVGRWWNGAHSYSQNAANLTMPLTAGACFCEKVGSGSVRHGVVELVMPTQMLRIDGALGPLQDEGASGALTFQIKRKGAGVEIVQTYHVGGLRSATAKQLAPLVDMVAKEQLVRLGRYAATGKPE